MISMSQTYSIRQLRKSGESISAIARKVGVSRNTVYAKLSAPDLSPQMPVKEPREKMLDAYRPVIKGCLDEDEQSWRKQRHTARRIWQRLRDEHGVADVAHHELDAVGGQPRDVLSVARVGQLVQHGHVHLGVLAHHIVHEVGADEATAARDDDVLGLEDVCHAISTSPSASF